MELLIRNYAGDGDYWKIRDFLRKVFLLNKHKELSWQVIRWDYWRWHGIENRLVAHSLEDTTFLWETPQGELAAVLNPEGAGEVYLQIDPNWRSAGLEEEMIVIAEQHLTRRTADGKNRLKIWAHADDQIRQGLLRMRGYKKGDWPAFERYQILDSPLPSMPVEPRYEVRALGERDELPSRSWASWRAFHPNDPDEKYEGWEWYLNIQRAPLYRRDLDIVAVSTSGEIAAFTTVWFDDFTRSGVFEPVGTMPEHQRRGLGKAVMSVGLQKLQYMGATRAYVTSMEEAAHRLYASVGFKQYNLAEPWVKEI